MNWHLNYTPPASPIKISHADKLLLVGSCFAENIGEKLQRSKFNCLLNPNGILFNPSSIASAITSYIKNEPNPKPEINNNLYFSFDHHGSFSSSVKDEFLNKINASTKTAHETLKEARWLIITFGSAFAYRHIRSGKIVANCHKLPQQDFKKELLTTETIVSLYSSLIKELNQFNPQLNIILTVSPVKYLRDGIVENNLSKAVLIQSVHQIISSLILSLPKGNCHYFPAYELVNDDLRDYRFYKEDMAHPNDQALNYVWEKFGNTYFSENTRFLIQNIKEITQASLHRPINENSEQHKVFKKNYLQKCNELEKEHPYLDLSSEKQIYS